MMSLKHFAFEFDDLGSCSLSYTIDEADNLSVDTDYDMPCYLFVQGGCVF